MTNNRGGWLVGFGSGRIRRRCGGCRLLLSRSGSGRSSCRVGGDCGRWNCCRSLRGSVLKLTNC